MSGPAYPTAHTVSGTLEAYFARHIGAAAQLDTHNLAVAPGAQAIETIIDTALWASLLREEGYSPKISLAFLSPEQAGNPLQFERQLPLTPHVLARLAPAVERPGIHLGVWPQQDELRIWGTTRTIPRLCFVLEVVEPGLLVVKYRRRQDTGKYANVVVLKGDEIKLVDEKGTRLPDCPSLITKLLSFGSQELDNGAINVLMQLAVSMRAHGRGGSLLIVPQDSERWRESILQPIPYLVSPHYPELAELMRKDPQQKSQQTWQEAFIDAVDAIAGLTAVDGAALMTDQYELLSFGAKIARRDGGVRIEQVIITEPVIDGSASVVHPLELGGTRHLSAAQFVHDQRDAIALVASQDGKFTIFAWSECETTVHAHRIDMLLL
ncbi:MAG TPA: hypothetical protein VKB46_03800 [Pyrinomonadaceae bacterium]|nr:hypothetical protein [Pyrinomonadaceae bacterium]